MPIPTRRELTQLSDRISQLEEQLANVPLRAAPGVPEWFVGRLVKHEHQRCIVKPIVGGTSSDGKFSDLNAEITLGEEVCGVIVPPGQLMAPGKTLMLVVESPIGWFGFPATIWRDDDEFPAIPPISSELGDTVVPSGEYPVGGWDDVNCVDDT